MINNKVVWISGASSGIGEATALLMAKIGYAVCWKSATST